MRAKIITIQGLLPFKIKRRAQIRIHHKDEFTRLMVFSALDQSVCWTSHDGWMGEFRKAWQQHCIDANKRNQTNKRNTPSARNLIYHEN